MTNDTNPAEIGRDRLSEVQRAVPAASWLDDDPQMVRIDNQIRDLQKKGAALDAAFDANHRALLEREREFARLATAMSETKQPQYVSGSGRAGEPWFPEPNPVPASELIALQEAYAIARDRHEEALDDLADAKAHETGMLQLKTAAYTKLNEALNRFKDWGLKDQYAASDKTVPATLGDMQWTMYDETPPAPTPTVQAATSADVIAHYSADRGVITDIDGNVVAQVSLADVPAEVFVPKLDPTKRW
jgi:hypothetical protein